ncbi:kinase [Cantharellus anzutake]|uniref:kinase n=1 Tax=Cantharellus anzutake TaxID=1750568 RepID=UPI0019056071|nr:kinase [Cantharellus anzutake]KAF8333560.1 kinase [Cantharellus anzutake]
MDLTKSKRPVHRESTVIDSPSLVIAAPVQSAPSSASRSTYHSRLQEQIATLDVRNPEAILDLRQDDLRTIGELGQGNGGTVTKVEHIPTHKIMAKKVVLIDAKPVVRKQILRELQIMHHCNSKYIISFHGAYISDPHICICMEYMDKGSLDGVYKKFGPIPIDVVALISLAVLEGLTYLYDEHRIIHRDIKPSNILLNSEGQIKICDFGVSGELINSIADTFVGTSTYMSPERIQGAQYSVKSDAWSLGISLIELALGRFPFADSDESDDSDLHDLEGTLSPHFNDTESTVHPGRPSSFQPFPVSRASQIDTTRSVRDKRKSRGVSLEGGGMTMSILELLQHIVNEPAPRLTPDGKFPKQSEEFLDLCLRKNVHERPTPKELLTHEWIVQARASNFDLKQWASLV